MKNKIISLVLIVFMMMVFSPIIHAETKPTDAEWLVNEGENHVWYQLTENTPTTNPVSYTLTIGGSGEMPDWDISTDTNNTLSYLNTPWRDKDTHYFKNITKIEIKEGITKIGNNSFSLAKNITISDTSTIEEVVLPESLKSIGSNAFKLNTTLEDIKFPSKLDDIGSAAFQGCGLKEVVLPESLKNLIMGAFLNNGSLEKVTLPSKLTSIGIQAFSGCTSLNTIISYAPEAPTLDTNALKNAPIANIVIPSGSFESYKTSWSIDTTSVSVKYIYTITFNTNGGTKIESKMVEQNNKLVKPTDPSKENYTFGGWYVDEQLNQQFDFNTTITKDTTLYAKWREVESFTYKFINGDNQELTSGDIKSYVLKIDGDYSLFKNLKIGNLDLIKNEDYEVTEGSTVITFTDKGIAKLNTLSKGEYEILVTYTNSKEVKGKVILNSEIENPKTGDNFITYLITGIISLMGVISISFYTRRKLVK